MLKKFAATSTRKVLKNNRKMNLPPPFPHSVAINYDETYFHFLPFFCCIFFCLRKLSSEMRESQRKLKERKLLWSEKRKERERAIRHENAFKVNENLRLFRLPILIIFKEHFSHLHNAVDDIIIIAIAMHIVCVLLLFSFAFCQPTSHVVVV